LSLDRLEHKQRLKALFDAIERLQTLDKDLFDVGRCLETLVTWWSNIKAQLEQITNNLEHHGVSFYRNDDIMHSVRDSWIHIKKEYSAYRDEVIRFLLDWPLG
jgi:hemerythrin superfamily protein